MAEVKREIRGVIAGVLSRKIERGVGAVLFQGFNALLKALELERRIREQEELLERIESLERAQGHQRTQGGHYGWR